MKQDKDLHGGHRDRVIKKFINYPQSFCEHEILETLLFYAIPRIDTNPLAHRLIDAFGSLSKVFNASTKELMAVEGVGEKVATYINLISVAMKNVQADKDFALSFRSPDFIKTQILSDIGGLPEEKIVLYMLDDNYNLKQKMSIGSGSRNSVSVDVLKLGEALVAIKPKYVLLAHNHPSGIALPSTKDDLMTERVVIVCAAHGVAVADHVIVADNDMFSYFSSRRLDNIKRNSSVEKMLDKKE